MKRVILITGFVFLVASATLIGLTSGPRFTKNIRLRNVILDGSTVSRLNLSAPQKEKIKLLNESYRHAVSLMLSQQHEKRAEIRKLLMQLKPDLEKIKPKQKEVHNLILQIKQLKTDYFLRVRNILTPKQLSDYLLFMERREEKAFP